MVSETELYTAPVGGRKMSRRNSIIDIVKNNLAIPDWGRYCNAIDVIVQEAQNITDGRVCDYHEILGRQDPTLWGVAACSMDGQRASWGDSAARFTMQSVSFALNYAVAANELGDDVHSFVGQEPSGRLVDELVLDQNFKPHNPMINGGALVICSLIQSDKRLADRFDFLMDKYRKFAGGEPIGFDNSTYVWEVERGNRNYAIGYYLKENKCFPAEAKLDETLKLYFQMCSTQTDCNTLAVMAATLANGGVCPVTGDKVISSAVCRDTLSLMFSCGMNDYSGQFGFQIGLPAKSGESGAIMLVIPNVMGFALYSPPLDSMINSKRGIYFCKKLIERFNFHHYDCLVNTEKVKVDPRKREEDILMDRLLRMLFATHRGDIETVKKAIAEGANVHMQDYDGRTALHIAASEGQVEICRFLLDKGAFPFTRDRFEFTAIDNARQFKRTEVTELFEQWSERFAVYKFCTKEDPRFSLTTRRNPSSVWKAKKIDEAESGANSLSSLVSSDDEAADNEDEDGDDDSRAKAVQKEDTSLSDAVGQASEEDEGQKTSVDEVAALRERIRSFTGTKVVRGESLNEDDASPISRLKWTLDDQEEEPQLDNGYLPDSFHI